MMVEDPIVAEVRAARAKLMEQFNYDLGKFLAHISELEHQHPERLITKEQLDALRGRNAAQKSAET